MVKTSEPKEVRVFDGHQYVLETALTADFALVRAAVGDRHGNLVFHESAGNFNAPAGMAGRITIAEVEELVEPGEIKPEHVHLPGVFVDRVVVVGPEGKKIEKRTTRAAHRGSSPPDDTRPASSSPPASPSSSRTASTSTSASACRRWCRTTCPTTSTSSCTRRTASSASAPTRSRARRTPT